MQSAKILNMLSAEEKLQLKAFKVVTNRRNAAKRPASPTVDNSAQSLPVKATNRIELLDIDAQSTISNLSCDSKNTTECDIIVDENLSESNQADPYIKKTCSFWLQLDKITYKETLKTTKTLSNDSIKYKALDNSEVIKITFPID